MNTSTLPSRTTLARARELYVAGQIPDIDQIPCVCKAPRVEHTGPTHAGGCAASGCVRYREDKMLGMVARAHHARDHGFDETMAAYDQMSRAKAPKRPKGIISVRPSDLRGCRKAIEYRENPPEDYVPVETDQTAAWMGTLIHDALTERRAVLYPWRMYGDRKGMEVNLPGSPRPYRYDEYDPITATLIEIKTAGDWRYEQVGQWGPDEKWLDQAMLYAWILRKKGYPVERVELLVLARENGKSEQFVYAYDEARALAALDWINNVATEIELGVEQPRDEAGPSTSTMCAKLCPARRHCWSMDDAEALGRSPENLVILGLNPADEEVEKNLSDLVATRESRLHLEKEEKRLRALLDGVELREYGEYVPTTKSTSGTAWKKYQDAVEAYWNDPNRPVEPPKPETSRGSSTTWGRLRKSERDKRAKEKQKALDAAAKALSEPTPAEEPTTLHVVADRVDQEPPEPLALPAAEAS